MWLGDLNHTDTWSRIRDAMIWGTPGESEVSSLLLISGQLGCATSILTTLLDVTDCALLLAMLIQSLHLEAIFIYSMCTIFIAVPYRLFSLLLFIKSTQLSYGYSSAIL